MTKPTPDYLRLVDPRADQPQFVGEQSALFVRTCEAFQQATGWALRYAADPETLKNPNLVWSAPVDPGVGASLGLIRPGFLPSASGGPKCAPLADAVALAEVLCHLWSEIATLHQGIGAREAELATGVPVVGLRENSARMAQRLEAILKAGAEAIGCQAAALYLLDDATTSLKLRASWGLPRGKLLEPARELAGALGDLEALLGHAVVLTEPDMNRYWHCPEPSEAAVCVPVSSSTTPLGTLWIFSDSPREFSDPQVNLIEVVAGRLAAELEREVLLGDARQSQSQRREIITAVERQAESLPRIAPLVERWQVAGRLIGGGRPDHDSQLAGAFFDWFGAADGSTALVLGAAAESGLSAALLAAQLRGALRAQADRLYEADRALVVADEVLSGLSAGGLEASAFCGLLPVEAERPAATASCVPSLVRDEIRFAAAGNTHGLIFSPSGCRPLVYPSERLAAGGAPEWSEIRTRLVANESLLIYAAGGLDERWQQAGTAQKLLASSLVGLLPCSAERLAAAAAEAIERAAASAGTAADGALLVVQAN